MGANGNVVKPLGFVDTSNAYPQPFLDARNSVKDCCAKCVGGGHVSPVDGYVTCESPKSPNRFTACSPGSICEKFESNNG